MNMQAILVLLFAFLVTPFYIIMLGSLHELSEVTKTEKIEKITKTEGIHTKKVYVEWILNHSRKISRQTAIGICDAAMSMDNGLLLIAIASRESSFSPTAVSKKGAIGLNQIMPNIWVKDLQKQGIIKERKDLFDYNVSLLASNYILTKYYNKLGSWEKALEKYVGHHKTYVRDVLAIYGELQLL